MNITFVECCAEPENESFDLVTYVETSLGAPIKRITFSDALCLSDKLWNPQTLVWFNRSFTPEQWGALSQNIKPHCSNVLLASTRLGYPFFDLTQDWFPVFERNMTRGFCIEYADMITAAMHDSFGMTPSAVIPNPMFDWDFYHDAEARADLKLQYAQGKNIAVIIMDYMTPSDTYEYWRYFKPEWDVIYYTPFAQSGEINLSVTESGRASHLGKDVPLDRLLMVADLVLTDRFSGPEFYVTALEPKKQVLSIRSSYRTETAAGVPLLSERGGIFFRSMTKFFGGALHQLDYDFLDHAPVYVQHAKIKLATEHFGSRIHTDFGYIDFGPEATSRDTALAEFIDKFQKIFKMIETKNSIVAASAAGSDDQ